MIEIIDIIGAIIIFGFGGFVGGYIYGCEKKKEELFEAKWDRLEQKKKKEEYKSKCESNERTIKSLSDDYNSLREQLKQLFKVLEDDGYETYLEYSPLVGYCGYVHKKRDKK